MNTEKSQAVATIDPNNLRTMGDMLTFGEEIVKSKLTPLKKAEDVVAAILTGKELGIPTMAAVNNIHPIEGRSSLGIHLICAKLLAAGISYKILHDYEPLHKVSVKIAGKDKDGKPAEQFYPVRSIFRGDKTYDGEFVSPAPFDFRTVIEFRRKLKQGDGTWIEMVIQSDFSWNDVVAAGNKDKDNYKKNPRVMVRTRALAIGSRLIADDLLLGVLETTEALDIAGNTYQVDKEGNVINVDVVETKTAPQNSPIENAEVSYTEILEETKENSTNQNDLAGTNNQEEVVNNPEPNPNPSDNNQQNNQN